MGKQTNWRAEVYYGGGMGSPKSIRCSIRWTGKKGQRGQDELWKQFWTDTIRPVLMDTPRWDRALARVSERREVAVAERAVAREANIAEIARVGAEEVQTDLTIKQVLGAVKKVLDDNKMTLSGYTKWKDKGIGYIIGQMKRIFDKGPEKTGERYGQNASGVWGHYDVISPDRRPVWEAFKALIEKKTGSGMEGGKKKGFLDFITKVGTTLGKPFKKEVGINPFTAGFDLGEKVIAPALMKVIPPRGGCGTSIGVSHLEKEMRNYQNIAHHLGQHLAESGSQDPKDQIGYYHFSKEANRIKQLIADIH
jgi:hypothetical protein